MTLAQVLESHDSQDLTELMAFDKLDPPDFWPSTIARLLYAMYCSWSSRPQPFAAFLPPRPREPQSPAEMRARLRAC